MSGPQRQHPNERRNAPKGTRLQRGRRGRHPAIVAGMAGLAVLVVAGAVWAVRAGGGTPSDRVQLYQGSAALGEKSVSLDALVGHGQPAVVNFWASNCPPCRMEMPGFQRVYDDYDGTGYVMLGVDVGPQTGLGTHDGARALIQQEAIAYPVGYAEGDGLVVKYGLRGMPTTLFFDASGKQVGRVVGYLPETQLRTRLTSLLANP